MERPALTTVEGLRLALEELGLSTKGHKPELKQRFRKAVKKQKESNGSNTPNKAEPKVIPIKEEEPTEEKIEIITKKSIQPFDYYLFFDVEATCEEGGGFTFPNEIIEFPVVLVDGETFNIIDEFQSYVKPSINPTLSKFCTNLTGITQSTVNASPNFIEVLNLFQDFLAKYSLFQDKSAVFVTDGPFDIRDFITKQCKHSKIKRPAYFDIPWVNIRRLFRDFYNEKENKNIACMLSQLKLEFQGREHSGLDDARNLVAIAQNMHQDGCIFKTNCRYDARNQHMYNKKSNTGRRRR